MKRKAMDIIMDSSCTGTWRVFSGPISFSRPSVSRMAKLELGYEMREASTGELKAEGTSGHFFYDRAKGRPVALKKALPEVYRLLEALTTPD